MVKVLLLDGLSHVPVGKHYHNAFQKNHHLSHYIDLKKLPKKFAYKLRRSVYKLQHNKQNYFYYPKSNDRVIKNTIEQHKPDIVLVIAHAYPFINCKRLQQLKDHYHFKLALLDTDSGCFTEKPLKLRFLLENELAIYDKIFSISQRMTNFFYGLGINNVTFIPHGASQATMQPTTQKTIDIFFTGSPSVRRLMHLEKLSSYNLAVYGKSWQKFKSLITPNLWKKIHPKNVWGTAIQPLLQQSKIILNVNNPAWAAIESGVNMRVFEALGNGTFLLTEYCEELHELFSVEEEIETFKTMEEMVDKIEFYLKHESSREKIAKKGYKKFNNHYTYEHCVDSLIQQLTSKENS